MEQFFNQIEAALEQRLYQLALFSALTIPDICGAMDQPSGASTGRSYAAWFDAYVALAYTHAVGPDREVVRFLTGGDCWGLRCSMLHQGRTRPHKGQFSRVVFVESMANNVVVHCNIYNDALMLHVVTFCTDLIAGARRWLPVAQGTATYERNYKEYLNRYPTGYPGILAGVPVIT